MTPAGCLLNPHGLEALIVRVESSAVSNLFLRFSALLSVASAAVQQARLALPACHPFGANAPSPVET